MTILMSFFGTFVFIFSVFSVGFGRAFKRLLMFIGAGFLIDCLIVGLSLLVACVN